MANFSPLMAEICWRVWGTPESLNGFRVLPSLLQRRRSSEANQTAWCLAISWAATLYIHFREILPSVKILPGAKFTLRLSLAFLYIGSVTALHSSSGRQPNSGVVELKWNYWTFVEGATYIWQDGHHVGHRPTFVWLWPPYMCWSYFHLCGFFFLFSSPNLSCWRLDVCHTSTHGVALV